MGSNAIRKYAIKPLNGRGFSLAMTLVFTVILLLIGIVITGLTTMQSRYSLERNSDIITRQAAIAGVNVVQKKLMDLEEWSTGNVESAVKDIYGALPGTEVAYFIEYNTVSGASSDKVCQVTSHGFFRREPAKSFLEAPLSDPKNRLWDKRIRMNFTVVDTERAITATTQDRPMDVGKLAAYSLDPTFQNRVAAMLAKPNPAFSYYTVLVGNTDIYGNVGTDILGGSTDGTPVLLDSVRVLEKSSETDWSNQTISIPYPREKGRPPKVRRFDSNPEHQRVVTVPVKDYSTMECPEANGAYTYIDELNIDANDPIESNRVGYITNRHYGTITLKGDTTLFLNGGVHEVDTLSANGGLSPFIFSTEHVTNPKNPAVFIVKKKLELNNVQINASTAPPEARPSSSVIFYINDKYFEGYAYKYCSTVISNSRCNCIFAGNSDVFINSSIIKGSVTGNTVTVVGTSPTPDSCKVEYRSDSPEKVLVLTSWEEL